MASDPIPLRKLQLTTLALDVLGLLFCLNVAFKMRLGYSAPDYLLRIDFYLVSLTMVVVFYVFYMYSHNKTVLGLSTPFRSWIATAVLGLCVALGLYLFGGKAAEQFGRGVLLSALTLFALWISFTRYWIDRWAKSRGFHIRWLVIGAPKFLNQLWLDYQKSQSKDAFQFLTPDGKMIEDLPIVGKWTDLDEWLKREWSGIIVCPEGDLPELTSKSLLSARLAGTRVYTLTDFYEFAWQKVPVYFLDRSWLVLTGGFSLLHNPIGLRVKRVMDFAVSLLLLPIAVPVLILAGLAIWIDTGLPIFYRQKRTGLNGTTFILYKLRTMRLDAEQSGAQWAKLKDNRVTKVGQFLRKTRIDELPQIWNVLIGDMSFIGPRPERPEFNTELEKHIPHYSMRHIVRPGITGWAQVLYPYGASIEDSKQKLQYDLYYIKAYRLSMDLIILVRTVRTVLFGHGR